MTTLLTAVLMLAGGSPGLQESAFDQELRKSFEQSGAPGAAVGVFREGKLVFTRAFGVANEEPKQPFKAEMQFEIGSLSKQFTAFSLLMLVSEGKLALGEKLGDILPGLPESWRGATVEQTLHHMSGIPDYEEIAGYDFYNSPRQPKEIIESAATKSPEFKPGEKFQYSNTGYFLLSMVAEKKSGMPLGKFLETRIFKPLGMADTYAETVPSRTRLPQGYHSRSGMRMPQPPIAWSSTLGAGGIVSTMADLAKWEASLHTEKLLSAAIRDRMFQPAKTLSGGTIDYGFGWGVETYRGLPRHTHSGQTNGFTCVISRVPSLKTMAVAFSNTYGGGVVFSLHRLALPHFNPELSYLSLEIPKDPDPARTALHLRALRQAALAEGDIGLLRPGVKDFATNPQFASERDRIKPMLEKLKSFRYIRSSKRKASTGQDLDEHLYRLDYDGGQVFWSLRFIEGLLTGLNWEVE
jgi:CubicO group peptidase (beta-lactamase class C family)